jgi:hypothetical protein
VSGEPWIKAEHRAVKEFIDDVLPTALGPSILEFLRESPEDQPTRGGPRRVLFANAVWKAVLRDPRFKSLKDAGHIHTSIVRKGSNCKRNIITDQAALFELWTAQHAGLSHDSARLALTL